MHFLREHWGAALAAVFVGLVILSPNIFFVASLGSAYQGIPIMKTDAEAHYLARMNGNPPILATNFSGTPAPDPTLSWSEAMLGTPARAFGISIPALNLFYAFLFPALDFLLLYALLIRLGTSREWALGGAWLVIFGYALLEYTPLVQVLRQQFYFNQFTRYARVVNPAFTSLFFFSALHALLSYFETKSRKALAAFCLLLAVSPYLYLYTGLFLLLCGISAAAMLWSGEPLVAVFFGLLFWIPYAREAWGVFHHPFYPALALRLAHLGVLFTHAPEVGVVAVCAFTALCFVHIPRRDFLISLFLAALVAVNQQVLTGRELQAGHFHWYFNLPIFTLIFVLFLFSRKTHWAGIAFACALAFSLVSTAVIQTSSSLYWYPEVADLQRARPALDWLSSHTRPGQVVLADEVLSDLVLIATRDRVVGDGYAGYYLVDPARLAWTPDVVMRDFAREENRYPLDYVLWDKLRDRAWHPDAIPSLRKVFDQDAIAMYAVGHAP